MKIFIFSFIFALLIAINASSLGLEITEMRVTVDYDEAYTYRLENRDRENIQLNILNNSKIGVEILPGSNVTFKMTFANTFSSNGPDIKNVFATLTIEEADDGDDLEAESDEIDLDSASEQRVDVKFEIPLDIDQGTYDLTIGLEGEQGENRTFINPFYNMALEIKKDRHDLRIIDVSLRPKILECDRKTKLTAQIANLGLAKEDDVTLEFRVAGLSIESFDKDIVLESTNEDIDDGKTRHTKELNFAVPEFMKAGTYPVFINLYWKNLALFDRKTAALTVKDCNLAQIPKEAGGESNNSQKFKEINESTGEFEEDGRILLTEPNDILRSPVFLLSFFTVFIVFVAAVFVIFAKRMKK
jgi:hypothetical protein